MMITVYICLEQCSSSEKNIENLFTNSMKYNKVNGSIYMSMRTIERSEDHVTCEFKIKDIWNWNVRRIYKK